MATLNEIVEQYTLIRVGSRVVSQKDALAHIEKAKMRNMLDFHIAMGMSVTDKGKVIPVVQLLEK